MAKAKVGSANNTNEKIQNYDIPAGMTEEQFNAILEQQRKMLDLRSKNSVELAGIIVEKRQTEPKMIIDKETGNPVVDENGQVKFYKANFFVKIAFTGGEKEINISEEWFHSLDYNRTYLFTGRLGLVRQFGKEVVDTIFHNFIEL